MVQKISEGVRLVEQLEKHSNSTRDLFSKEVAQNESVVSITRNLICKHHQRDQREN